MRLLVQGFLFVLLTLCSSDLFAQERSTDAGKKEGQFIEATTLLVLEKYESSKSILIGLLKEDKQNAAIHFQISRCFEGLSKHQEALDYARNAVKFDSKNTYYYEHLIDLIVAYGSMSEAIVYAEKLSQLEPQNQFYFDNWMALLVNQENYKAILTALENRAKQLGDSPELLLQMAGTKMKLGQVKQAEAAMLEAQKQFPKEPEISIQLIAFYLSLNEVKEAQKQVNQFNQKFPYKEKDLYEIPKIELIFNEKSDSSDNPLSQLMQSPIDLDQKIQAILPYLTALTEEDPKAKQILLEVLPILEEQYPSDPKITSIKGDIYFYSNAFTAAAKAYERCLESKKNLLPVWEHLLYSYWSIGQFEQQIKQAEEALFYFPNQAVIWYYYCLGLSELHRYDEALMEMNNYSFLLQGNKQQLFSTTLLKLNIFIQQEKIDEAKEALEILKNMVQGHPDVIIAEIKLLTIQKNGAKKALELVNKSNDLAYLPEFLAAQAQTFLVNDKLSEAEVSINQALERSSNHKGAMLEIKGDILLAKGQKSEAKQIYQDALTFSGYTNRIQSKLNKIN